MDLLRPAAAGENLSPEDCMRLLATTAVGRVALTRHALPVVLPVSFALDGHSIVVRTGPGSVLVAAHDREVVVAFQVDDLDADAATGWSVLVTGTMREITEASELVRAEQLHLRPWIDGPLRHFVRIVPGIVSGRWVGATVADDADSGIRTR